METQAKELNHRKQRLEELEEKVRVANENVSYSFPGIFLRSELGNILISLLSLSGILSEYYIRK